MVNFDIGLRRLSNVPVPPGSEFAPGKLNEEVYDD